MTVRRGAGMRSGRRVRSLATLMVAGSVSLTLALSGCSDDGDGADGTGAPTDPVSTVDTDGDGTPDSAEQTREAVPPPTEAADIQVEPGDRSASGGTSAVIEGDRAAFVLPSGNVACTINEITAVCQVEDRVYSPSSEHLVSNLLGDCTASEADAIMIVGEGESGAWTCIPGELVDQAWVAAGGWWARANDSETIKPGRRTLAVLPYGSSIQVGSVSCISSQDGVQCSNSETGRSFQVSRNSYRFG
ncbi:hypothetical protein [Ornithinimicrobium sp. Y1694]|uniref:hypothetical protein n=1 Tax=Ornithinimicrobium sp. Y1694 TaxID=3418590 RepID=UPI003CEDDC26